MSDICPVCGNEAESIIHYLFTCVRANEVWRRCFTNLVFPHLDSIDFQGWLKVSISDHGIGVAVMLWILWCSRNKSIFDNTKHSVFDICAQFFAMFTHISNAYNGDIDDGVKRNERLISWKLPLRGVIAVNVDAMF